ncbi:M3 family metallopeptidase [Pseudomonadota bacterium]
MATQDNVTTRENPLLKLNGLPRFHQIEAGDVEPALDLVLARCRESLKSIVQDKTPPSWDAVVRPLEEMENTLNRTWAPISHLHSVLDSDALRESYEKCLAKLTDYYTELGQNSALFEKYQAISQTPEFDKLEQAQQKIISNGLRDFRLSGVHLASAKKDRYKQIQAELAGLCNRFEQNILDATHDWTLNIEDKRELTGLPQSLLDMAADAARESGESGWHFTLDAPSYIPFLTYADNRDHRESMYRAYVSRASDQGETTGDWDNSGLIVEILRLRKESAELLGFKTFSAYSLETKMANNVDQILGFLNELKDRAKTQAEVEYEEVVSYARTQFAMQKLQAWDIPYYSEKLRQKRYAFTQEEVRPYFPEDKVLTGLFALVSRLYDLAIKPVSTDLVWHQDVKFFHIEDRLGNVVGKFYLDLFARAHKRGGAWMADCVGRRLVENKLQIPVAFLTCNFSPPVGGKPSLFTHEEVMTLFHEFGHGLHHLLTKVDYLGVSGINGVEWDAVELPSQFMENWCWQQQVLDLISGHYETGETLPTELFNKMIEAKNFQSAMQLVRQIEFSLFDMRLYTEYDGSKDFSVQTLLDEIRRDVAVIIPPKFNRFQNSFSHIFAGGYAAGYYSYKWAEVLSADAFSRFEEQGLFDAKIGEAFKHEVLEKGGSRDAMQSFVAFRGREPEIDALLRHSGLD